MSYTNQELFDKIATHLITQNEKAVDSKGHCVYLNHAGKKCAVGCLFDETTYSKKFEGITICYFIEFKNFLPDQQRKVIAIQKALEIAGIEINQYPLLSDLQKIHDTTHITDWKYMLTGVALKFKLNSDVLKN
jgi:hypothetical protein